MSADLSSLSGEDFCYVTTIGCVTRKPHEIEIWFGLEGRMLYLLSGGGDRSDWVRNLQRTPEVSVRIGRRRFEGRARIVKKKSKDALARRLLVEKYAPRYSGSLADWRQRALPVAIDLGEDQ